MAVRTGSDTGQFVAVSLEPGRAVELNDTTIFFMMSQLPYDTR